MNKKYITVALLIIALAIITSGCTNQKTTDNDALMSRVAQTAEKIEVVHFHGTQQCWSCITVGELALKTITEKFSEEYQSGTIVYMDINVDLPENVDIVNKFKARGASLYVNAIVNGQDTIEEDTKVWRLVHNEEEYVAYLQGKLNGFLK